MRKTCFWSCSENVFIRKSMFSVSSEMSLWKIKAEHVFKKHIKVLKCFASDFFRKAKIEKHILTKDISLKLKKPKK